MSIGWNFPSNNYGTLTGIGEAGIETFRGSPYKSLTREICQNSLDARLDNNKPVVVEFSHSMISTSEAPGYDQLKSDIKLCSDFWTEQNNKKTVDFFKKALTVIGSDKISLLRISDFNTTGLTGSDKEYSTPWQNLVKAAGVSDKSGASGGSYGIGKSAPFACSYLRTVFYATHDKDGLDAFQGIARLVSFKQIDFKNKDRDSITTGIGYYGDATKNSPIRKCHSLDKDFSRSESGTDVYILGFTAEKSWKDEIVTSVLENFLISIYNNDLVVVVDNEEISKETLADIIEKYKEQAKMGYNYYKVLTDENASMELYNFEEMGKIELRILIQQGFHRKVMMCRKNGMKIFDQKNISGSIPFAGICILKDDIVNEYFREMENPQHDAWEPERHSRKSEAKKKKQLLSSFIREAVLKQAKQTTLDELDAEGAGEFIPDILYTETNNQNKTEAISDKTKNIDIKLSPLKDFQRGFERTYTGDDDTLEEIMGDKTDTEEGDYGAKDMFDGEDNQTHNGNSFGDDFGESDGVNGIGNNPYFIGNASEAQKEIVRQKFAVKTISIRLFVTSPESNTYSLTFSPQTDAEQAYIQLELSGEQSSTSVKVLTAKNKTNNDKLLCKGNKISLGAVQAKRKYTIEFALDYDEQIPLEVNLYGFKE